MIESSEIEIRPAKYFELEVISENNEGSNLYHKPFDRYVKASFKIEPQHTLVAEIDNNLAGHMLATSKHERVLKRMAITGDMLSFIKGTVNEPPLDPQLAFGAQVMHVAVYPEYRNRGMATLLIKRISSDLKVKRIKAWIKEANTSSRKAFEKAGWSAKKKSRDWIRYELIK
ncbi:MAG: GNAT family N-acetyltransferase [Halobacteriota archaeon]|nr:GNAT family N-acetyltransferase [Halobacteriota archaeon]